jgi:putative ABC transport system permease protein
MTAMGTLIQNLKFASRIHKKNLGVSLAALFTLALGIGSSTAVFSTVNAILLKPPPYPQSERIVIPWRLTPPSFNLGYAEIPWGLRDFRLFLQESKTFQEIAAFKSDSFNLTGNGDPRLLEGIRVSSGFFPILGRMPAAGRVFTLEEDTPGHGHVVVLSYQLWQEQFAGKADVIGSLIHLNGEAHTVLGVMPADFSFPRAEEMPGLFNFSRRQDLWVPLALPQTAQPNQPSDLVVIGKLKQGVTLVQAQEEMNVFSRREDNEFPRYKGWFNSRVTPLSQQVIGDTQRPLLLLLGAVIVVMLISCANVGNLLLARAVARKKEFVLRTALGAGQKRLMAQLLTEGLSLAILAGILGGLIAEAAIYLLKIVGPANIPRLRDISLDLLTLVFALGISILTGIIFGLAPATSILRGNLSESLKEDSQRSSGSVAGSRLRNIFLVAQVAFAVVLVIAAGLLVRTFLHLLQVDAGFNPGHVLTFRLSLSPTQYPDNGHIVSLYTDVLNRLKSLPGVDAAGLVYAIPMDGGTESGAIRIIDHPVRDDQERPFSNYTIASPGYFSAIGTPLIRGRDFLETDVESSLPVAIINNAMAKKYWPGEDPIGKQVGLGSPRFPLMTIVGIVADVKRLSMRETPPPEMYVPYTQKAYPSMLAMFVVLRTKVKPFSMISAVRKEIQVADPELPLAKVATLDSIVDDSMIQPRFSMLLLGSFGGLALLLASVGIYSVISYNSIQRSQEIGIRMALGARPAKVFRMVLGEGVRLTGLGLIIGCGLALIVSRMMASLLYGIKSTDAYTFTSVCLLILGIAFFSCYFPARRAIRVDPIIALRGISE